jgi:hypothetical protein
MAAMTSALAGIALSTAIAAAAVLDVGRFSATRRASGSRDEPERRVRWIRTLGVDAREYRRRAIPQEK